MDYTQMSKDQLILIILDLERRIEDEQPKHKTGVVLSGTSKVVREHVELARKQMRGAK